MTSTGLKFVALTLIILTASCSPEHDSVTGSPSLNGVTLNPNPDPALKAAAENILVSSCINCHGSSGTNQKFLGTAGAPGLDELAINTRYVSPGQEALSLLAQRAADGSMPPGSPINSGEAQAIKDWIDDLATINDDGGLPATTFTEVETQILTPLCYTCHSGGAGGITFSDYQSVRDTIVTPGNIDSAFYQSTARITSPMPKNGTPLNQDQLALIESWIMNGALDN